MSSNWRRISSRISVASAAESRLSRESFEFAWRKAPRFPPHRANRCIASSIELWMGRGEASSCSRLTTSCSNSLNCSLTCPLRPEIVGLSSPSISREPKNRASEMVLRSQLVVYASSRRSDMRFYRFPAHGGSRSIDDWVSTHAVQPGLGLQDISTISPAKNLFSKPV